MKRDRRVRSADRRWYRSVTGTEESLHLASLPDRGQCLGVCRLDVFELSEEAALFPMVAKDDFGDADGL
jgi:hypothetical protein